MPISKVFAAAVQAPSVFLYCDATGEKAAWLTKEAMASGAGLVVFPEAFGNRADGSDVIDAGPDPNPVCPCASTGWPNNGKPPRPARATTFSADFDVRPPQVGGARTRSSMRPFGSSPPSPSPPGQPDQRTRRASGSIRTQLRLHCHGALLPHLCEVRFPPPPDS